MSTAKRADNTMLIRFVLIILGIIGTISCTTNAESPTQSNLREQRQSISGDIAYIREREQLYLLDITNDESQSIASFLPSGTDSGEWPKITFIIEKDNLVVRGGMISNARPVDESGQNSDFYQELYKALNADNIDMPTPSLRSRQYIYNSDGLVRVIIEQPTVLIQGKKVMIIGNEKDYGIPLNMHSENGETLKAFIPAKGYLVIPQKLVQTILRIDVGNRALFPKNSTMSSIQHTINDYLNMNLTLNSFSSRSRVFRVYYASKTGGTITIASNKKTKSFFLSPYQMVICLEPKDSTIETTNVVEFPNQVIW